ncbi:MAG: glycosyltransferase family 2 protein [Chitinophagaceae bacterium]|nr:glycosyltransferase family 2 protein [Chitinophagaceae bacterium]
MRPISVVIIAKNEAHIIGETLKSLHGFTDDIVIGDTGSTDKTVEKAESMGCRVERLAWEGFGKTKNKALALAKYEWVLFLDADEAIDATLLNFLLQFPLDDVRTAYKIRFKNFIGKKWIRYGEWGRERKIKLFHRSMGQWDNTEVHEKIILHAGINLRVADGFLLHYLMNNLHEYAEKMNRYAELVAHKYYRAGKKAGWFKLYLYPSYQFIVNYIFWLGFLDGRLGFITSFFSSYYAFLKYHRLKELIESGKTATEFAK